MIEALDETIKQLLIEKMPLNLAEVDVSFDVPNREWSGAISKPTINIYLHDIRENLDLRVNDWTTTRTPNGQVTKTKLGGRYDLSYLITAWTNNVEDEHRLLWYVLATLVRFPYLPNDILEEPLRNQPYPLITKVAQPDGVLRNAADVWTALDNQLKPVLTFVVTIALDPHYSETTSLVRSKFLRFMPPETDLVVSEITAARNRVSSPDKIGANGTANGIIQSLQIGGYVRDENDQPLHEAEVILFDQGLNVKTDTQGRYSFNNVVDRPKCTFYVGAPGYTTLRQELTIPAATYDFKLQPETKPAGS